MVGIFSCITPQPSVNIPQAFQNTINKANDCRRVSTSNLNNLLKVVKNAPEQLTFHQYREIQKNINLLDSVLKNQHSKRHAIKNAKIDEAFSLVQQKLSPEAKAERANETVKSHTTVINEQLDNIKQALPHLKNQAHHASDEVISTIAILPKGMPQQKANQFVREKNFSMFDKNTAITDSLFPSSMEKVETRNGYRNQRVDTPFKSIWVSLERLGEQESTAKADLSTAKTFLNHPNNLTFNKADSTGRLELTDHQRALIEFGQAISRGR